jgi:hypothetical protein
MQILTPQMRRIQVKRRRQRPSLNGCGCFHGWRLGEWFKLMKAVTAMKLT